MRDPASRERASVQALRSIGHGFRRGSRFRQGIVVASWPWLLLGCAHEGPSSAASGGSTSAGSGGVTPGTGGSGSGASGGAGASDAGGSAGSAGSAGSSIGGTSSEGGALLPARIRRLTNAEYDASVQVLLGT